MRRYIRYMLLVILGTGCKDPFDPPVTTDQISFLVVDGMVNSTDSTISVKLSRAIKLSSTDAFPTVDDASVLVEQQNGTTYIIPYKEKGIYQKTGIYLSDETSYRLKLTTSDGRKYSSTFVPLLKTPDIDSVKWIPSETGVEIFVNSNMNAGGSRYYRWNYVETWQYNSTEASMLEINNEMVSLRTPEDQIYNCWAVSPSSEILIKSNELLGSNLVENFKLTFLPVGTEKLAIKYSILVQQRSITDEAFNFWDQLKKSTEGTGGLFDPLPSQVIGNIQSDNDPNEIVLGYFSASSVSQKRIFISVFDLPEILRKAPPSITCQVLQIPLGDFSSRDKSLEIIATYGMPFTLGYTFSTKECVDCRSRGGTNIKPSFWN